MSTSKRHASGKHLAYARKALISSGKLMTQLCACVPEIGTPNIWPVSTLLVELHPPMTAARAP